MKIKKLVIASLAGAVYAALTLAGAGLSFGPVQCRFSEALCILPFFIPCTSWGLAVGCALINILGGYGLPDIVFGSLATLAAGMLAARIRHKPIVPLPAVLFNAVVVGAVISLQSLGSAGFATVLLFNMVSVGVGQTLACYGLGLPLLYLLPKIPSFTKLITIEGEKR